MAKHFKRNKKNKRNKGKPKDLRHKMKRTQSGTLKSKPTGRRDSLEGNTDASEEVEPRDAINTRDPADEHEDYGNSDEGKVLREVNGTLDLTCTRERVRSRSRRNRTLDSIRSRARMRTRSRRNRNGRSKMDVEEDGKNAETFERTVDGDLLTSIEYIDPIHNQLHLLGNRELESETRKNPAHENKQLGDLKAQLLKNDKLENELQSQRLSVFKLKYGDHKVGDFKSEQIKDLKRHGDLKNAKLHDGELNREQLEVCGLESERPKVEDFKCKQSRGRKIKLQLFEDRRTKRSQNVDHKFQQLKVDDFKIDQIKDGDLKTVKLKVGNLKDEQLKVGDIKSKRPKVDEIKCKQSRGRKIQLQLFEDRRSKRSLVKEKLFVDREFDTQVITDSVIKSQKLTDGEIKPQSFTDGGINSELIDGGMKSERLTDGEIKFQMFTDSGSTSQSLIDDGMKSQLLQKLSTLLIAFESSWQADFLRGYVGQISRLEDRVKAMILCPQLEKMYLTRFRGVLQCLKENPTTPLTALRLIYDRLEKALHLTDERSLNLDQEQERHEILATQYLYERERERFLRMFPELEPQVKTIQQVELEATQYKLYDLTNQSLPYPAQQNLLPGVRDFILQAQKTPRPKYYNLFEPIDEDMRPKLDQCELSNQEDRNLSDLLQKDDHRQDECPKVTANPSSYTSYKCTLRNDNSNSPNNSSKDLLNNIFNRKICLPKDAVTPSNTIFNRMQNLDNSNGNKTCNLNHNADSVNSNKIFSNRFDILSYNSDTTNNRIHEPIGCTNNPNGNNICSNRNNEAFHITDTTSKIYNPNHSRIIFSDKMCDPINIENDLADNVLNDNTIFSSRIYDPIQSRTMPESKNILDDLFNKSKNTSCSANYTNISTNICNAPNYHTESKEEMSGDVIRFFRQYEQLYSARREAVPEPFHPPWNSPEYTSRSYPSPHHPTSFMVDSKPNTPRFYQPMDYGIKTQDTITTPMDHIDYEYLDNINKFNENINKFFCNKEYMNNNKDLSNNEQDTNRILRSEEQKNNEYFNKNEHITNVFECHENFKNDCFKSHGIKDFTSSNACIENENYTSQEHEMTDKKNHLHTEESIYRGTGEPMSGRSKHSAQSLGSKRKLSASRRTMYKTLTRKISRDKILPYKILTRGKTLEDFIIESGAQESPTPPKLRPAKSVRSIGERKTKHRTIGCSHQRTTSSSLTFKYVSTVSSERKSTIEKSESTVSSPKGTYYNGSYVSSENAAGTNSGLSDRNISTVATHKNDIHNNALLEFLNDNRFPKDISRGFENITDPMVELSMDQYVKEENKVFQNKENEFDRLVSKEWQTGSGDDLTDNRYEWSNQIISNNNHALTQIQKSSQNFNQIINCPIVSTQSKSRPNDSYTYNSHHGDTILTQAILNSAMSPSGAYSKYARDNHAHIPQEERSKSHSLDSQPWLTTWKSNLFRTTGGKTIEGGNDNQVVGDPPMSVRRSKEPTFDCLSRFKTNLARRISFGNRPDSSQPELNIPLEPQPENPTLDKSEPNLLHADLSSPSANPLHRSDKMKLALNAAYESPQAKHCDDFHFPSVRETLKRFRIYRHWDRSEVKTDRQMTVEQNMRRMGPWQVFKYHWHSV